MFKSLTHLAAGLTLITLAGCGGDSGSTNSSPSSRLPSSNIASLPSSVATSSSSSFSTETSNSSIFSSQSTSSQNTSSTAPMAKAKLLSDIADLLNNETCTDTKPYSCEKIEVEFEAPAPKPGNTKYPTVLIIDNHMASLAVAAYRSRVLELLTTDTLMNLVQYRPKTTMPVTVNNVFTLIKNYDGYLSVQDFSAFNTPKNIQLFTMTPPGEGHGYYIATFLLEHNPTAKFVFVESGSESKLYAPAETCSQLTSVDATESTLAINIIRSRYENFLASLKNTIEQYNVGFINASWGLSRPVLSAIIKNTCDAQASEEVLTQILAIDHQFIKSLASHTYHNESINQMQEVALVQAATYSKRELTENDPDYPADCDSSISNRIRVMDFMYAGADIPKDGSSDTSILGKQQLDAKACVDIFIPLGQTQESDPFTGLPGTRRQAMKTILYGFFEFDVFPLISSPSLASPVVLSSLINAQSTNQHLQSPPELYGSFLKGNIIHDPILHNQFDVFTWQYRTPAW